jgi:adenine-specific DNA-methyltransferase
MKRLKPHILAVAGTATLRQIVEDFKLAVGDKRKRQELGDAVSSARRCKPEDLLGYLSEVEIKQMCEAVGIESRGRKKALIERLLEAASPAPLKVTPPKRASNIQILTPYPPSKRTTMSNKQPAQALLHLANLDDGQTTVEKYEFEPIKGYPMLNWRGKRLFTSTQYYPAQLKEVHGEEADGWRNKLFWGDNLQVMSHLLKSYRAKVKLIYIDPPFDSGADYKMRISLRGQMVNGDSAFFEEKQYTDLWSNDEYLQFMYERLVLLKELLADDGTLYLHCDPTRGHYIKILLDDIFGQSKFRNEVIWTYSGGAVPDTDFPRKHDTIFRYSKGSNWTFNTVYKPYNELTAQRMRSVHKGVMVDVERGTPVTDWWTDIKVPTGPRNQEKSGYPTQKPLALLERIITVSSNPGDLVLDVFAGSGTTLCAAQKLGRRFIGADINLAAIQTTTKRLVNATNPIQAELDEEDSAAGGAVPGFEIYNVNHYDIFRNPIQAKELLIEALEVQKLEMSSVFDGEKDGRMVKIMPVNRIATRADLNELIAGFDYKAWARRQNESPNRAVERISLVCMGHERDLKAQLEFAAKPFKVDVEVVDILRDKADLEFKRDSEAKVSIKKGELIIERFFPMNLLQKLSLQKGEVTDWREMVESVLIDWNYDGAVLQPREVDIPSKDNLVKGSYKVPDDAGTIRVKITDLLSESWEGNVANG